MIPFFIHVRVHPTILFHFLIIHISSRMEKCQKFHIHAPLFHTCSSIVDLFVYWRPLPYYSYPIISTLLCTYVASLSSLLLLLYWCTKPMTFDTDSDDETHFFQVGKQKSITFLAGWLAERPVKPPSLQNDFAEME